MNKITVVAILATLITLANVANLSAEDLRPSKSELMAKFLLDGITLEEAEKKADSVLQNLYELSHLQDAIDSGATLKEARLANPKKGVYDEYFYEPKQDPLDKAMEDLLKLKPHG